MVEIRFYYCWLRLVYQKEGNSWQVYDLKTEIYQLTLNVVELSEAMVLIKKGVKGSDVEWLRHYRG